MYTAMNEINKNTINLNFIFFIEEVKLSDFIFNMINFFDFTVKRLNYHCFLWKIPNQAFYFKKKKLELYKLLSSSLISMFVL